MATDDGYATMDYNQSLSTQIYSKANDESLGSFVLDIVDTILSGIGFIFNAVALIIFLKHGKAFGFPIKNLLVHQSFLDCMACFIGFIIHLQPSYWHVNNYYWEVINCYLWHSQYFFWYFLYTSANNLVYLAYDRYRAVVHPLHYKDISKSKVYCGFVLTHVYSVVVRWPILLWIRMDGDTCVGGWVIKGKYGKLTSNMYGVFEFIVHYLVHMVALVFFYGKVIRESKKMLQKQEDTTSANTQKSLSVVTKAAIAVTVVFILTFSWNSCLLCTALTVLFTYGICRRIRGQQATCQNFLFLIFAVNVLNCIVPFRNYTPGVLIGWFKIGSPIQKTNVLAGAINSACNPVFYYMYMPSFRRAVIRTFLPCVKKYDRETSASNSATETSTDNLSNKLQSSVQM